MNNLNNQQHLQTWLKSELDKSGWTSKIANQIDEMIKTKLSQSSKTAGDDGEGSNVATLPTVEQLYQQIFSPSSAVDTQIPNHISRELHAKVQQCLLTDSD